MIGFLRDIVAEYLELRRSQEAEPRRKAAADARRAERADSERVRIAAQRAGPRAAAAAAAGRLRRRAGASVEPTILPRTAARRTGRLSTGNPAAAIGKAVRSGLWGWSRFVHEASAGLRPGVRRYTLGLSNLFIAFGLALLMIGGGVRVTRQIRLEASERARPTPSLSVVIGPTAAATMVVAEAPPEVPPDRLAIPAINLETRVVEVGWSRVVNGDNEENVWQTADYAAGFHKHSAMPGHPGNTVISGHNNISGSVFKDLNKLEPGQRIFLYSGGKKHEYEVVQNFIVQEAGASLEERHANAEWIAPTDDERLTLLTCYPPWSNTHRTIVIAKPVSSGGEPMDMPIYEP